ncbi:MAG: DUF4406 domain-containing protein [Candidatus Harrisonbacteria bacterium]|nr:DUF4406 domain-containing protein [Candidatus Harrisonbacteria bacterium]
MEPYWLNQDIADVQAVNTFEELADLALRIIRRMPQPVAQVCGPITSGGLGSVEKNLERFQKTIDLLRDRGESIFNQMLFEQPMFRIKATPYYQGGDQLLHKFYLPIFESGLVKILYFMSDWQSSYGAKWEHEQALRLGIKIRYLSSGGD